VAGSCEHGKEPSGSIKVGEFPDYLSDYQLLKKDSLLHGLSFETTRTTDSRRSYE
jgi:hypothetical protein